MSDSFDTIAAPVRAEPPRIRGSRFVGIALPIADVDAAHQALRRVRSEWPDASHHCFAYRIDANTFRSSDDNEPSGTAGPPILRQIDSRGLEHVLVVVVRYFGGTKLGAGGLVRAYGDTASATLDHAEIVSRTRTVRVRVIFGYEDTARARRCIGAASASIVGASYTDLTKLDLEVPESQLAEFVRAFTDALGGRGQIEAELKS